MNNIIQYNEYKRKWSFDETCQLIELYKETPAIWDPKNPDYKNRYKKIYALKNIAAILNTSVEEVDKKLKNIHSQYNREKRHYRKLKEAGMESQFHAKWFGYALMSFLQGVKSSRNIQQEALSDFQESDTSTEYVGDEITEYIKCEVDETLSQTQNQIEHIDVRDTFTTNTNQIDNNRLDTISMNSSVQQPVNQDILTQPEQRRNQETFGIMKPGNMTIHEQNMRDDFDLFGDIVARNIRKLRTHFAQCTVQHLMNNILYEAQLGKYDAPNRQAVAFNRFQEVSSPTVSGMRTYSNVSMETKTDIPSSSQHDY